MFSYFLKTVKTFIKLFNLIYIEMTQKYMFEGRIREIEKRLIEFYISVGNSRGQPYKLTSILGYLMIHGSLTKKELSKLTGLSIATVSNTINAMEAMGYLSANLRKGTNAKEYSFGDLSQLASKSTGIKINHLDATEQFLKSKMEEVSGETYKKLKGYNLIKGRLEELLNFIQIWKNYTKTTMGEMTK